MSTSELESRLPPDTIWQNGKIEQHPRTRSVYDDFTAVELLLREAMGALGSMPLTHDTLGIVAGKVLALKERVCALKPEQRAAARDYRVTVIHQPSGTQFGIFTVRADDLKDAEQRAVAKSALDYRADPSELVASRVHELCAACGREKEDAS